MKISNDMFDGNNKKVVSPSPPNRNSNEDVNLESDTIPKQNIFGMEKWKKIVVIVIAVIVFVVGVVAIKSFISPSDSDAPKTTVSSSSKKSTTGTNKNAIKDFVKESDSSGPSSTKESSVPSSKKSDSSSPSSTKESSVSSSKKSETDDSTTHNSSSENSSDSPNNSGDSDVSNIQQRIQSSLPDLTIGDTQLHTNTDVVVRSTKTTNGVESVLTANDKPFAIITTKDGTDSLKLLAGYQAFALELKTQK